jgi:hypothetical protein
MGKDARHVTLISAETETLASGILPHQDLVQSKANNAEMRSLYRSVRIPRACRAEVYQSLNMLLV